MGAYQGVEADNVVRTIASQRRTGLSNSGMFKRKVVAFLLFLVWTPSSGHWRRVRFSRSTPEMGSVVKALARIPERNNMAAAA